MKSITYITVSTFGPKDINTKSVNDLLDRLTNGYTILSAVGDGQSVHYILGLA